MSGQPMSRDERIIALSEQGWSLRMIADELRAGKNTVSKVRARHGFVCTPEMARASYERGVARAKAEGTTGKHKNTDRKAWSPEAAAHRAAMIRAKCQDPEYRARLIAQLQAARNAVGNAEIGRRVSRAKLPWCPEHLKDEYRVLTLNKRVKAAEARRIVEADWLAQLRRALRLIAALAPMAIKAAQDAAEAERCHRRSFAGQMERVAAGAALVPTLRMSRPVSMDRSLIGNAEAML